VLKGKKQKRTRLLCSCPTIGPWWRLTRWYVYGLHIPPDLPHVSLGLVKTALLVDSAERHRCPHYPEIT
ncbi:hypothetical protein P7K49_031949, partial [Saguinus oedipus]